MSDFAKEMAGKTLHYLGQIAGLQVDNRAMHAALTRIANGEADPAAIARKALAALSEPFEDGPTDGAPRSSDPAFPAKTGADGDSENPG